MFAMRPVGYVIGLLVTALGLTMLVPMAADWLDGNGRESTFASVALVTVLIGAVTSLACANARTGGLSVQQTFLLTVLSWLVLPIFGALPFWFGAPNATFTDAFFEAMSGMTTTGSTVFTGLDDMPVGTLLWRSMLQWFGGVGIIVVAMAFLPTLRVGGMQVFRSEAFDTMGKILPRAAEIAGRIGVIYLALTAACFIAYLAVGMGAFDALIHTLTTVSTGGFSNRDISFAAFQGAPEYVASVFMILSSLPFVRYVQIIAGTARPLLRDTQVHAFLALVFLLVVLTGGYRMVVDGDLLEPAFREGVFNVTSIMSGTGYASTDYQAWGAFPSVLFFMMGLIGGCAGSTCCAIKIFRFQILFSAIGTQIRRINHPSGIFHPRFDGRPIDHDALSSVMAFFTMFMLSLGVLAAMLGAMGLSPITAISGAATALANIGPGLGPEIGPSGNFAGLPDGAKWLLSAAMLIGRLELMSVYVLFTFVFWRR
ncbi:TrkH family potassium uptake protein [Abyssibius alkaniclasticus]|uniref:TrkH family potassium uptake protein n=1 Tax=Abyssibius alkaniclasticus TaxID=2881234 RepID=UPI00236456C1|nr:TrkH family potassium uptake protein [Abyssibius alkaniclasticus]UPH70059.1 TrkH family potassium uptake protein [Abyssibius alkaniclasticus]